MTEDYKPYGIRKKEARAQAKAKAKRALETLTAIVAAL